MRNELADIVNKVVFTLFQEIESLRAELDVLKRMALENVTISDGVNSDDSFNNNSKSKGCKSELESGCLSSISFNLDSALEDTTTIKDVLLKLQTGRETKFRCSKAVKISDLIGK